MFRVATTIGTNIIVQGRGAKAGLLVSAGAEEDLYGDGPAGVIGQGFIRPEMITGIGRGHGRDRRRDRAGGLGGSARRRQDTGPPGGADHRRLPAQRVAE